LRDVRELVCEQLAAFRRARHVASASERDVLTGGVGTRADRAGRAVRSIVDVHANSRQVEAESRFEELARGTW
jgi:hypothetical protein